MDAEREEDLKPKGKKRSAAGASEAIAEDADTGPACLPTTAQVTYLADKAQGREGCRRIASNARKIVPCVRHGQEGHALILGTGCDRHLCATQQLTPTHLALSRLGPRCQGWACLQPRSTFLAQAFGATPSTLFAAGTQLISSWRSRSRGRRRATGSFATRSSLCPRSAT